ncbi:hypothetical protein AAZX31_02G242600 [Glycine max]|uniref:Transmembrane protein n=2 Tax=Glycine subgen. Soja TaxID=1462606 RepID=K7KAT3_SOYBN|nr:uncharacterized protein LOC100780743 [Glycine max]XP_028217333.1 uncharacterized protein LOC114399347 [Glycine soja]KAG5053067.1 hypothetical protein JHK87_005265 [Glycine soja]KAG5064408.1 hypothetical protein JHK85_005591 [Glycine max]KAG5081363.1 hypothetical protein JHK86_005428 [Glycine max]KAH1062110.1 hypothetical protein GYH30_005227 [Glycine max]KRH73209.1 hypothetical protein GLYMA_02G258600v4 [Glycine max]|eukprot:XP_003518414.2 uncharacterized protein LOC100780743 [Glycine max]
MTQQSLQIIKAPRRIHTTHETPSIPSFSLTFILTNIISLYFSLNMTRYHDPYYYYLWEYFSFPLHLIFFVLILFFVLAFSWYINYESLLEDLLVQVKIFLALVPLLLLLLVHCLSSGASFPIPLPEERESLHRAGGSPWGVALLLLFVLFMMAYQSSFHQRWFPLATR